MIAVDTNVLIYACDQADLRRQRVALDLIATRRTASCCGKWPSAHAWSRLAEFRDLLPLVLPTDATLARAKELHVSRGASLWDALILAACVEAAVEILYSEDVPGFDDFEGVRVVNPFK